MCQPACQPIGMPSDSGSLRARFPSLARSAISRARICLTGMPRMIGSHARTRKPRFKATCSAHTNTRDRCIHRAWPKEADYGPIRR